jgi:hypothetical protein
MPATLAHYWILQNAVNKVDRKKYDFLRSSPNYRPYSNTKGGRYDEVSQFAFLGSIAPDLFYYGTNELVRSTSDMCHHKKTGVFVANMFDEIAKVNSDDVKYAARAFVLGYICHIAADIIVHPYVNSFAGDYYLQKIDPVWEEKISWALKPLIGWASQRDEKKIEVKMHMFAEVHQDAYIATKHYGCGDELSNGPGDTFWGKSWSDYWSDLITGGIGVWGHNPKGPTAPGVIKLFHESLSKTLNVGLTYENVEDALGNAFDGLDLGYDMASGPPVDKYVEEYVNHKSYKGWKDYEYFLGAAADVTATDFWPAANDYYEKSMDRKSFLKIMGNWNLDTGYMPRVYNEGRVIHVRYEHSWAKFL